LSNAICPSGTSGSEQLSCSLNLLQDEEATAEYVCYSLSHSL